MRIDYSRHSSCNDFFYLLYIFIDRLLPALAVLRLHIHLLRIINLFLSCNHPTPDENVKKRNICDAPKNVCDATNAETTCPLTTLQDRKSRNITNRTIRNGNRIRTPLIPDEIELASLNPSRLPFFPLPLLPSDGLERSHDDPDRMTAADCIRGFTKDLQERIGLARRDGRHGRHVECGDTLVDPGARGWDLRP